MKRRMLVLNGSPRPNGNTEKALESFYRHVSCSLLDEKVGEQMEIIKVQIPYNLVGCMNCVECSKECNIKDGFQEILAEVEKADYVMIGTPVYLDMPTAQTVALLTRLNCVAESTGREFFRGKKAYLLATAYCSGTKSVLHTLMGACEMLGFDIEGRSTREYVTIWKDEKIRGGRDSKKDSIFFVK